MSCDQVRRRCLLSPSAGSRLARGVALASHHLGGARVAPVPRCCTSPSSAAAAGRGPARGRAPGEKLEHIPSGHGLATGVLAPGPGAVDDLAGGLVPVEALEHERAADPVAPQPHRLGAFFNRRAGVDGETAVLPGEQVLHDLVGDLAAGDEEAQHLGAEELFDLGGVEGQQVPEAAVG